jgi:hypothetical protein
MFDVVGRPARCRGLLHPTGAGSAPVAVRVRRRCWLDAFHQDWDACLPDRQITVDRPDAVIQAIRDLLDRVGT